VSNPRKYTLLTESTYQGYPVQWKEDQSPLIKEALDRYIDQIEAITSHYEHVFLVRFDLHLPKSSGDDLVTPDEGNRRVSQLFATLKENKFRQRKWGNQSIKTSAYGWCNELEKAKQVHYHCWIAVAKGRVENAGYINPRPDGSFEGYGFIGMIYDLWQELNPEGRAHVHCNASDSMRINSSDPEQVKAAVHWLSYLTKARGKVTFKDTDGDPIRVRRFDGSRIKRKVQASNQDNYANPV